MNLQDAKQMGEELVKQHCPDYTFSFMVRRKRYRRAGQCHVRKKLVQLQPTYVEEVTEGRVRNTILHEIAHALTPKHGHNKYWKRAALAIGCDAKRTFTHADLEADKQAL